MKHKKFTDEVKVYVIDLLKNDYLSEQITGTAKKKLGVECVSHETTYQFIWNNKKNKGVLYQHLRYKGQRYRKRGSQKDKLAGYLLI